MRFQLRSKNAYAVFRSRLTAADHAASSPSSCVRRMKTSSSEPPDCFSWAGVSRAIDAPTVEHGQPIAQTVGLVHVVGGEHDRGVVLLAQARAPCAERPSWSVGRDPWSARQAAAARATSAGRGRWPPSAASRATCAPSARAATLRVMPRRLQDLQAAPLRLVRARPYSRAGVQQVLHRTQLLEERRVDADAIDELFDPQLVADDVEAEDLERAAVGQQQRRDDANQRRLARAVGAQNAEDLAASTVSETSSTATTRLAVRPRVPRQRATRRLAKIFETPRSASAECVSSAATVR